jgi:hypothetical protein
MPGCRIYEGPEAVARLTEMGLAAEDFVPALADADADARRYQSDNDAKNASGMVRWARTVGLVRQKLSGKNWTREDPQNLPLIAAPSNDLVIIVTTGDEAIGDRLRNPKTQYPKGPATDSVVAADPGDGDTGDGQLSFMDLLNDELGQEMSQVITEESVHRQVWFLLYHFDKQHTKLRAELSRPASMKPNARIVDWLERIMLGEVALPHRAETTP